MLTKSTQQVSEAETTSHWGTLRGKDVGNDTLVRTLKLSRMNQLFVSIGCSIWQISARATDQTVTHSDDCNRPWGWLSVTLRPSGQIIQLRIRETA